jgi:uncharacterized protein with PQ loop repeat
MYGESRLSSYPIRVSKRRFSKNYVLPKMKVIGWIGTALVMIAYYPQIHHLLVERCAWGIGISTWLIWFIASTLLLLYCVTGKELLMTVVQIVSITAIATTIILVRRSNRICPYHRKVSGMMTRNKGK